MAAVAAAPDIDGDDVDVGNRDWILEVDNAGKVACFFKGAFLPCWNGLYGNETDRGRPKSRCYIFLTDALKLKAYNGDPAGKMESAYRRELAAQRYEIELSMLVHGTTEDGHDGIEESRMIKPKYRVEQSSGVTSYAGHNDAGYRKRMVWFTASGEDKVNEVRESIRQVGDQINTLLESIPETQDRRYFDMPYRYVDCPTNYATSAPFNTRELVVSGRPAAFTYEFHLENLLGHYSNVMRLPLQCIEFRCLGTTVYKKEVMFSVIVIPPIDLLSEEERTYFDQCSLLKRHRPAQIPSSTSFHLNPSGFQVEPCFPYGSV